MDKNGGHKNKAWIKAEAIYAEISEVKFANGDPPPPARPARRKLQKTSTTRMNEKKGKTKPSMVLLEIPKNPLSCYITSKLTNLRYFLTQEVLSYYVFYFVLLTKDDFHVGEYLI